MEIDTFVHYFPEKNDIGPNKLITNWKEIQSFKGTLIIQARTDPTEHFFLEIFQAL